jgi:hypothetical protein
MEKKLGILPIPNIHMVEAPVMPSSDPFAHYLKSLGTVRNDLKELRQRFIDAKYTFQRDAALQEKWKKYTHDICHQSRIEKKQYHAKRLEIRTEFIERIFERLKN